MTDIYKRVSEFLERITDLAGREEELNMDVLGMIEGSLFQGLFFTLADDGQFLNTLFHKSEFPKTWYEASQLNRNPNYKYFHNAPLLLNSKNSGTGSCGRQFMTEGILYTCVDCDHSYCDVCFKKEDHDKHLIDAEVKDESEECTCPNKQPWNHKHHCSTKRRKSSRPFMEALKHEGYDQDMMKKVYEACLDFMIIVMMHSNQHLPVVQERFRKLFQAGLDDFAFEQLKEDMEKFEAGITSSIPKPVAAPIAYISLLHTDGSHTKDQIRKALKNLNTSNQEDVFHLTEALSMEGRAPVNYFSNLKDAMEDLKRSFKCDVPCSIISSRGFQAGEIVKLLVNWISLSFPHINVGFIKSSRRTFAQAMTSKPTREFIKPYWNLETKITENPENSGLMKGQSILNGGPLTRLQFFLFFDVKVPKNLRQGLKKLIEEKIFANVSFKVTCATQTFAIYDQLTANHKAFDLSNLECVLFDSFPFDFYYFPDVATAIGKSPMIGTIVKSIHQLFTPYQENKNGRLVMSPPPVNSKERDLLIKSNQYIWAFFKTTRSIKGLFISDNFKAFTRYLEMFSYSWLVRLPTRELRLTAAVEITSIYTLFSDIIANISTMKSFIKDVEMNDFKGCLNAMLQIANQTHNVKYKIIKGHKILEYDMANEVYSMFFQSNCIISKFFQCLHEEKQSFATSITNHDHVFNIADRGLRTIVLNVITQISPGADNLNLHNAKLAYTEVEQQKLFGADLNLFVSHIHLVQVALLVSPSPTRVIYNILERFDILDWYLGKSSLEDTVHRQVTDKLISKVMRVFYLILTERSRLQPFTTKKQILYQEIRRNHIKRLCLLNDANLKDIIPDAMANTIEEIVHMSSDILAEITGVDNVTDREAKYNLVDTVFNEIDPMSIEYFAGDYKRYESRLVEKLTPKNAKAFDKVLVEPKLNKIKKYGVKLGEFSRSTAFAKLLTKLISIAVEKKKEYEYLPLLLHMVHAILKDIELSLDEKYFPTSFVKVPLTQCLFSLVVYSKFSKNCVDKADYLLEWFIFRNKEEVMEGLKGSFGEDAVLKYRIKKLRAGLDFDKPKPS